MAGTRTLLLLRHAKAAWPDGVPDLARPLAERGRRDAVAAGQELRRDGPIALVVRSPALRVEQTCALALGELVPTPPVQLAERLYGGRTASILALISELPETAGTVLLIGHNPDLSVLASGLSGVELTLRTASIVRLELTGPWSAAGVGRAELARFVTPRAL